MKFKLKKYEHDGLTVLWDYPKCIHAEKCWRNLGDVFRRNEKPWINLEAADQNSIRNQIDQCPSGALSYISEQVDSSINNIMEIDIVKNGPALIKGNCKLTLADGTSETKSNLALCRCGASANKPFCDGSHKEIEFED